MSPADAQDLPILPHFVPLRNTAGQTVAYTSVSFPPRLILYRTGIICQRSPHTAALVLREKLCYNVNAH
jgi:hypothetical protein